MNIYDGVWVFGEEFGFPICTFSVILDSRLNFGRVPSSRSQTCGLQIILYPLSYRLFPHSFFPIFFILIPSVRLLCFPLCFLSPFRFLLSFFPFRHLLCLSYAINLFWSDRGNQQPAMSRMVRHDLSRKKKVQGNITYWEDKKGSGSAPGKSWCCPTLPHWLDLFLTRSPFPPFPLFPLVVAFSSSPDYFPLYIVQWA